MKNEWLPLRAPRPAVAELIRRLLAAYVPPPRRGEAGAASGTRRGLRANDAATSRASAGTKRGGVR
jgi:hypothetical protein